MSDLAVIDLGVERLLRIDARIDAHEGDGLRARWEFGHELVAARDGKGRLPNGYLADLVERTGKSRAELKFRTQFAERYPTEHELANALANYGSWYQIVRDGLAATERPAPAGPPPVPEGKYATIVIDPPWAYDNRGTRAAASKHYETLTIAQLAGDEPLPYRDETFDEIVDAKAADDAHLYLWVTNGFLRQGFELLDAWQFTYKTCVTWVKPQLGIGNWFRGSTEHILFATRGTLPMLDSNQPTWFAKQALKADRGRHSRKPDSFYDLVETCSPGPRLSMFDQDRNRLGDGWEMWGTPHGPDSEAPPKGRSTTTQEINT